jgi:hypothetical protein
MPSQIRISPGATRTAVGTAFGAYLKIAFRREKKSEIARDYEVGVTRFVLLIGEGLAESGVELGRCWY